MEDIEILSRFWYLVCNTFILNIKKYVHVLRRYTDTKYTASVTTASPFMEAVKFIKALKETFRASQKLTSFNYFFLSEKNILWKYAEEVKLCAPNMAMIKIE